MDAAFADFSKFIGYELKKEQTEAISSVLSDSDVLVVLPTSFGKSMIYQALPWLSVYLGQRTSPIVLVISPLVAIMKNQVVLMKRKGINAAFIGEEQQDQQVISTIRAGHIPLVYGSPEAILSASWRSMLVSKIWTERIIAVAIDEAHLPEFTCQFTLMPEEVGQI